MTQTPDRQRFVGLAVSMGWKDVRGTYQRSILGPWWISMGLAIQVGAIGVIFGFLFGADFSAFLPYLAVSFVLWNFMAASINDSTSAYVQSQQIIKQMYVPSFFPVVRVLSRNLIVLAHNSTVAVLFLAIANAKPGIVALLAIPGLVITGGTIYALSTVAAVISARFRDVPPIIASVLTVSFYLTPVIWMPESLPENLRDPILTFNPLNHLLQIIRGPLLGSSPSVTNWLVSLGLLAVLSVIAAGVAKKYSPKIVYWL